MQEGEGMMERNRVTSERKGLWWALTGKEWNWISRVAAAAREERWSL
jgi:hypothetical protein